MLGLLLLLAFKAEVPAPAQIASVEITFSTRAGEGAAGVKRLFRDGCYTVESAGGTGGGRARDSQAGCHRRRDVAAAFARLDALATHGDLVPEAAGPADRKPGLRAGWAAESRLVLVRDNGSRWTAPNAETASALAQTVEELPGENQWYPNPPDPPPGKGPALVVLSVARSGADGPHRLEAALVADGRWWCYRSVAVRTSAEPSGADRRPPALAEAEASARLARILQGAHPPGRDDAEPPAADPAGAEISVEAAFADGARVAVRPRRLARTVADRFAAEMRRQSATCAAP